MFFGMLSKLKIYLMLLYQSEVHLGKKMINPMFFCKFMNQTKGKAQGILLSSMLKMKQ